VLGPGTRAPDFTLRSTPDQSVSLSEFRGRPVVLAFYPADWSPVCGDQMALYNEILDEFQEFQAELLGISVDGAGVTARSPGKQAATFRFCPTLNRKERSRALTVFRRKRWHVRTALFVINPTESFTGVMSPRSYQSRRQRKFCPHRRSQSQKRNDRPDIMIKSLTFPDPDRTILLLG